MTERRSWTPAGAEEQRVVLVGAAQALQDEAARVAAAAGVGLILAAGLPEALRHHPSVVLLAPGADGEKLPQECPAIVVGLRDEEDAAWSAAAKWGAGKVAILPQAAGWLAEHLGRARAAAAGPVLGVVGAAGGSGASTLSCWLADCAASAGSATLLVDGNPLGGGLELALGDAAAAGLRWQDLDGVRGALNPAQFAAALPRYAGFSVLSHGPLPPTPGGSSAAGPVLDAARQAFQLTVVDLGAGAGLDDAMLGSCAGVVLLVPARLRPVAAAAALLPGLAPAPVTVVLRGPVRGGLLPHRVAEMLEVPEPSVLPHLPGVPAAEAQGRLLDRGRERRVRRLCRGLLGTVLDARSAA
ncbi:septum site-determining protein Ssd [Arthrobacter sp. TMN-37]